MTISDNGLGAEIDDHVAVVTLARPERLNALTHTLVAELHETLVALDQDEDVRCIVLTGECGAFSSGADLAAGSGGTSDPEDVLRRFYNPLVEQMLTQQTPLVAAVNGVVAGAGVSLALACDLRIASESASFRLAFVGVGLVPDAEATWLLPRLVGAGRAAEVAMLDRAVSAREALSWGLVTRVVTDAECADAARETAKELARSSSSVGAIRRLLHGSWDCDLTAQLEAEATAQGLAAKGGDYAEARSAFREKRRPRFGRS